jgi:hypothetical protein
MHPPQAKFISAVGRQHQKNADEPEKGRAFIKMGLDLKRELPLAHPAARSMRADVKGVIPVRQRTVAGKTPPARRNPIAIDSIEPELILKPFGRAQKNTGVADLDAPRARVELHGSAEIDVAPIGFHTQ